MKKVVILGGGTFSKVACHLSLATPAFGTTAKKLFELFKLNSPNPVKLVLTKMADSSSTLVTNEDVESYVDSLLQDASIGVIVMNVAMCDFKMENPSFKERLDSSEDYNVVLEGIKSKVLIKIKEKRPDILTVAFSTTSGATVQEQSAKACRVLKYADYVFANDVGNRRNMLRYKDHSVYDERDVLLNYMVKEIVSDSSQNYSSV